MTLNLTQARAVHTLIDYLTGARWPHRPAPQHADAHRALLTLAAAAHRRDPTAWDPQDAEQALALTWHGASGPGQPALAEAARHADTLAAEHQRLADLPVPDPGGAATHIAALRAAVDFLSSYPHHRAGAGQ